jgi:hypothetical protein
VNTKLNARKICPRDVLERINGNAYRLKLLSHIKTFDIFNVCHMIPYHRDSTSEDDAILRASSPSPGRTDTTHMDQDFLQTLDHLKRKTKRNPRLL